MSDSASLTQAELLAMLERHRLWVDTQGREGEQADLRSLVLSGRAVWPDDLAGASVDSGVREDAPLLVSLDDRRGMAAQKATDERRLVAEVAADQSARDVRHHRLEDAMAAAPAASWVEVGEKAQYLAALFAATAEGRDPRHRKLIAGLLDDIRRLSARRGD